VQGEVVSGQLYRVRVSDEIYDACHAFPADIRVVDDNGNYWPYFLWLPPDAAETVALKRIEVPSAEAKVGVQTLMFDAGARNRQIQSLQVHVEETNFARPAKIFGRNSVTNTWRWVGDGGIHRLADQSRDSIELRGCAYRWLKVELYQYENPPLTVTNVEGIATPQYIVFEAGGASAPRVYYASSKFTLPYYDLQKRVADRDAAGAPLLKLGARHMNPLRLALGLGRYGHWLTLAAAALFVALAGLIVAKLIRQRAGV